MRNWTKIVVKRPKMFHFMTIRISSFSPKLDSPAALKLIDKQIQDENTYESAFIHSNSWNSLCSGQMQSANGQFHFTLSPTHRNKKFTRDVERFFDFRPLVKPTRPMQRSYLSKLGPGLLLLHSPMED